MSERSTALRRALALAAATALIVAGSLAGVATGASPFKKGRYTGTTNQERVEKEARTVEFRLKGRKISLTGEPAVAKGFCIAAPVFLLDEDRITTRLNSRGAFSFSRTFIGSKVDRIKGRFNDKGEIEGTAVYHFRDSDSGLCSAGKSKVKFTARHRKG